MGALLVKILWPKVICVSLSNPGDFSQTVVDLIFVVAKTGWSRCGLIQGFVGPTM